jgi:hypothetical protein
MNYVQAQTLRLIRANHRRRGDNPTRPVGPLLPKQRPRRVRDPQPMTTWNGLRSIQPTRCVPRVNSIVCDFDFRPQPRRGASGGPHNAIAPAISSSQSSALFAARITEGSSTTTSPRSDDRATDRASHRVANRTVLEGESSSTRGNGSAAELHEHVADAKSAANSGQPPLGRPNPTSRPLAPQTTASKSSRPVAGDDVTVERVARYPTDSVRAPCYYFNPQVSDSDIRPQPRRGASGPHNPTAPGLSSSKSSALFAPRITESPSTTTIPQSDDRATDRETHRVAKRTVPEDQSPYSNSSKSRNGSVADLHEHVANSAANSSQPPTAWGRPNPTSRSFAPQTTASESSRTAASDDAGQVGRYQTDVVCTTSILVFASLTLGRSLGKVRADHIALSPLPLPSLPTFLTSLSAVTLPLISWSHHRLRQ